MTITNPFASILVLLLVTSAMPAQDTTTTQVSPATPISALRIGTISLYGVYYSHRLPNGGSFQPGATNLPSDFGAGGSIVVDWTKFTDRSAFSLTYTPSFTARARFSSLDALNHNLNINVRRKLAPRWILGFSMAGDYSNLDQSLFAPTALSNAASVPSTFNDLAGALLTGKFSNNPQLGVALTNVALLESPLRTLLYGERMLTVSGQTSLAYSYSPRLSIKFSGQVSRAQHASGDQAVGASNAFLLPNTTSGNVGAEVSYSLSPLTQLGGSITTSRVSSILQDYYTTTSQATFGRTIGRWWLLQAHGGMGFSKSARSTTMAIQTEPRPAFGGSLAFKTTSTTLLGAFDRTVADTYGLGANTSSSANGAWRWQHPGSSWWLETNGGWQQLSGDVQSLANTKGVHVLAGFGRIIGQHISLLMQYTYLTYSGKLPTFVYNLSQSAVRVSFTWYPQSNTTQ